MDKKKAEFNNVFTLHAKSIFRFAYFKVSDYDLAEDITEETFVRFWKKLLTEEDIKNYRAFLYFITHGLIVDHYRTKVNKHNVSLDKIDERMITVSDDLEKKIDEKNELDRVHSKLREIKKEYKDIILLYYIEELDIAEIAYILKKKENAVRVNIHRALKALKEKL